VLEEKNFEVEALLFRVTLMVEEYREFFVHILILETFKLARS
jgi:hypothetical protein